MFKGLIGKKLGMTQVFSEDGNAVPVTIIEAGHVLLPKLEQLAKMAIQPFKSVLVKLKKRNLRLASWGIWNV